MTRENKPQKNKPQENKPQKNKPQESISGELKPSRAITKLAVPAALALLAKAVYNIADTAYIGMLGSDIALAVVGVTLPLLSIMISVENIFTVGAAVPVGRQLEVGDKNGANRTATSVARTSVGIRFFLCVVGVVFMEPLLRSFGVSEAVLPQVKDYTSWMFIVAIANPSAQSMNCVARVESSVKISSVVVIAGATLNVALDPIFMSEWSFGMGVGGASLATTVSQFVTFFTLGWFYMSGRSVIKIKKEFFRPHWRLIEAVTVIRILMVVIQICLAVATPLTNIAAKPMADADLAIAAYGVVQWLTLISCHVIMRFMQGYQPVASLSFGVNKEERFHECVRLALWVSLVLTVLVAGVYVLLVRPLIMLSNQNPAVIGHGAKLLISQAALYPAFGLCYMITIIFQIIGASRYGLFLSVTRQGLFYVPFTLVLPRVLGVTGIYLAQPAADILTILVCLFSVRPTKRIASESMVAAVNGTSPGGNSSGGNNPHRRENT